ncbi:34 kDa spicule matrix protein-like [Ceratitis capitata]|uniref:34 kDa spicule matrix protein-like n=1 Tax=Ceratitis capitata TaxID=7213 RepID=UPI0003299809|nr:34 kDa spicule matrix protein-like [Ceratitis capitata]
MRLYLYIFLLCTITLLTSNAVAKADEESNAASKAAELLSVDTGVEHSDEKPRLVRQFGFGGPGFGPGFGGPGFGGGGFGGPGFGGPGFGGPGFGGPGFGGPGFGRGFGRRGGGGFGGRRFIRRRRPFGGFYG